MHWLLRWRRPPRGGRWSRQGRSFLPPPRWIPHHICLGALRSPRASHGAPRARPGSVEWTVGEPETCVPFPRHSAVSTVSCGSSPLSAPRSFRAPLSWAAGTWQHQPPRPTPPPRFQRPGLGLRRAARIGTAACTCARAALLPSINGKQELDHTSDGGRENGKKDRTSLGHRSTA
uniref:Uncharacterized protein n=1 Tax=Setaria viridis TaxID=4556 RepID=A0A4V6D911_SETVI|nr:hypothetical protein SEVIR_3G031400v2 [Setaria viridis]TKW24110.1 hypothetical protein SEVIR_3G031400v2 [Setaria viridis]TKW24111.1 hypothetical protein SEVIR_3G031400v2 [Setaria viridis]TKW24112.1 hypothetical protein SEVIR_3G031400v2 [Setaria viridis]TKW24113.1 hypothetical protein SEVIR_3G031400v2 [Setaria viridis]